VQRWREVAPRKAGNPMAQWDPAALPSRLAAPCVQPAHAVELAIPTGGEGSRRGSRRRWRGPAAGRTSSRLCPLLVVCAGSGRAAAAALHWPVLAPSWLPHRSRKPSARQRPAGRHVEASSCTRMLTVEDQGRRGAVARCDREELLQCGSHLRALLAGSRRRRVGHRSKPVWDQNETRTEFRDLVGRFVCPGTGLTQRNKFKYRQRILLFLTIGTMI
jgi:hypothetical protein